MVKLINYAVKRIQARKDTAGSSLPEVKRRPTLLSTPSNKLELPTSSQDADVYSKYDTMDSLFPAINNQNNRMQQTAQKDLRECPE